MDYMRLGHRVEDRLAWTRRLRRAMESGVVENEVEKIET